jgi:hypothetical protein
MPPAARYVQGYKEGGRIQRKETWRFAMTGNPVTLFAS